MTEPRLPSRPERATTSEADLAGTFDPADKDQPAEGGRQTVEEDLDRQRDEGTHTEAPPARRPIEPTRP